MIPKRPDFDPLLHLCYNHVQPKRTSLRVRSQLTQLMPSVCLTRIFQDIGYSVPPGTSDLAYTAAFPLLTPEAVKLLRAEFLQSQVKDRQGPFVRSVPGIASYQVRGYGGISDLGNFTKQLWTNPTTLEAISHGTRPLSAHICGLLITIRSWRH
jgi:hypothetical protein